MSQRPAHKRTQPQSNESIITAFQPLFKISRHHWEQQTVHSSHNELQLPNEKTTEEEEHQKSEGGNLDLPSTAELMKLLPPLRTVTKSTSTTSDTTTRLPLTRYPVVRSLSEVRARQEYLTHFTALLQAEREAEETNNILRLRQWSVQRLVHEGYTLVDLTVVSQQIVGASPPEEGLRINVKFRIPPSQSTSRYVHSMRLISGDSVRLYPMTTSSSSSSSYFFSAKVLERSTNWILVCCPHTHQLTDQLSEREMHWRIDYETNLTTYSRLLRAVQTFVNVQLSSTTHPEIERWQQLLIDKPQTHSQDVERLAASPSMLWTSTSVHLPAIPLSTSHLTSLVPEWSEWPLNPSQRNVIVQVLCRQLSLIQGPPGTGKTHTAVYLLKLLTLLSQRVKGLRLCPMLVCAYTNIAVDNLLEGLLRVGGVRVVRLGRPVKVRPELSTHTLDYRVQQHPKYPSLQMLLERVRTRQLQPGETITTLQQTIRSLTTQIHSDILSQVDCVCATCVGAGDELLDSYSFPLLLVDEATQVSEPALLIGLLRHVQQLIMFGDHFQLPPTVVSEKAQQGGLGISLFARLAGTSLTPSSCETHPNELRTSRTSLPNATDTSHRIDTSFPTSSLILVRPFLLQYQYRMHPLLSHFVNWHFYGGVIRDAVNASSRPPPSSFPWPRYDNTLSSFVTVSSLGTQSSLQYDPHHLLTGLATNSSLECVVFSSSPSEGVAPVAFVHVPSVEEATDPDGVVILSSSSSDLHPSTVVKTYRNTTEATILIQTLKTLLNLSVVSKNEPTLMISDVGIITPYRGQLQLINDMLHKDPYFQRFRVRLPSESEQSPEDDVFSFTLDEGEEAWTQHRVGVHTATVDGFQGREKEVILLSCVRSNDRGDLGFLRDWRRLNVALSRAKRGLIVFGSKTTLTHDPHWRAWLQWMEANHFIVNVEQLKEQQPVFKTLANTSESDSANSSNK